MFTIRPLPPACGSPDRTNHYLRMGKSHSQWTAPLPPEYRGRKTPPTKNSNLPHPEPGTATFPRPQGPPTTPTPPTYDTHTPEAHRPRTGGRPHTPTTPTTTTKAAPPPTPPTQMGMYDQGAGRSHPRGHPQAPDHSPHYRGADAALAHPPTPAPPSARDSTRPHLPRPRRETSPPASARPRCERSPLHVSGTIAAADCFRRHRGTGVDFPRSHHIRPAAGRVFRSRP